MMCLTPQQMFAFLSAISSEWERVATGLVIHAQIGPVAWIFNGTDFCTGGAGV